MRDGSFRQTSHDPTLPTRLTSLPASSSFRFESLRYRDPDMDYIDQNPPPKELQSSPPDHRSDSGMIDSDPTKNDNPISKWVILHPSPNGS